MIVRLRDPAFVRPSTVSGKEMSGAVNGREWDRGEKESSPVGERFSAI